VFFFFFFHLEGYSDDRFNVYVDIEKAQPFLLPGIM